MAAGAGSTTRGPRARSRRVRYGRGLTPSKPGLARRVRLWMSRPGLIPAAYGAHHLSRNRTNVTRRANTLAAIDDKRDLKEFGTYADHVSGVRAARDTGGR